MGCNTLQSRVLEALHGQVLRVLPNATQSRWSRCCYLPMFVRHGSARTEPEPPPSWEALKQACSAKSAELAAAANAASAFGLDNPLELTELSLSDLAVLLPAIQPVDLLRLRSIAREVPRQFAAPPGLETGGKIAKPPGLHPSAYFFGKMLSQESELGSLMRNT